MRATLMYSDGDVRVEDVPDSVLKRPTDALVRVASSCICGSDLHPYGAMSADAGPARMGHEFIGVVEGAGPEVSTVVVSVRRAKWPSRTEKMVAGPPSPRCSAPGKTTWIWRGDGSTSDIG